MSIRVVVPQVGQSIAEATIVKWFKQPGDRIEKGETLVEIGTDKINTEIPAPESGVVERLLVAEGETVPVETEIAVLSELSSGSGPRSSGMPAAAIPAKDPASAAQDVATTPPVSQAVDPSEVDDSAGARYTPLVRRLAQERHVDLSKVKGTGRGGRITKEDVLTYAAGRNAGTMPADQNAGRMPALHTPEQRVPMTRMRKLIAEHMLQSKRSTAELTTVFEIDMTRVARLREEAKRQYEQQHKIKLTYLPLIIAATARALKAFPVLNSSIDGDALIFKNAINVGVATAVEDGLLVPVIRDADQKTVLQLARALDDLGNRARNKRLTAEELQGGTFSVTNPGSFGAILGTPIIHYPQVAILGVGAVVKRPVVINDAIAIRAMAFFSLTYDHRALDGSMADRFLAHIKNTLENECPSPLE